MYVYIYDEETGISNQMTLDVLNTPSSGFIRYIEFKIKLLQFIFISPTKQTNTSLV